MAKRRIVFIVTQDCQLRCHYCYLVGKNKAGKMTWETAKRTVDFLMSLPVREDEAIFDFIGGEPFLEIDLVARICSYLVGEMKRLDHPWLKNYSFRVTTNGVNYASDKVQRFICEHSDHLSVQISIDGTKRKHDLSRVFADGRGSYDAVYPNVKLWLQQFGEKAMSFMVVSHEDICYLSESVIHLIETGVRDIVVSMVVENVWQEGDDAVFEKELMAVADYVIAHRMWDKVRISSFREDLGKPDADEHIFPCGNPMYVFDAGGVIYSCVRFAGFSLRSKKPRAIGDIYQGIDANKLRPLLSFDRESCYPAKCMKCEIASGCRWCPAENYDSSETGTVFQRTTTVCALHQANVRVNNYYWNRINFIENNER